MTRMLTKQWRARRPGALPRRAARTLALCALVLGALAACQGKGEATAAPGGPPGAGGPRGPAPVLAATATRERFVAYATFTAELLADRVVDVTALEAGQIVELLVREGALVAEGEVLARLDDDLQRRRRVEADASLRSAQARMRQAEVELTNHERELARRRPLQERGAMPLAEWQALEDRLATLVAAREVAAALVEEARQQRDSRQADLTRRVVRAPFAGRVVARHIEAGAVVGTTTALLTLLDEESLELVAHLSEARLPVLREGARASFRLEVDPSTAFTGYVTRVGDTVEREARTVEVRFRPELQAPAVPLRHGMFARGRLEIEVVEDAVVVPQEALEPAEGGGVRAWRIVEGQASPVDLTVLLRAERRAAVTELQAGDRVITSPTTRLQPGSPVRILREDAEEGR